jgi:hypothetical protein
MSALLAVSRTFSRKNANVNASLRITEKIVLPVRRKDLLPHPGVNVIILIGSSMTVGPNKLESMEIFFFHNSNI